MPTEMKKLLHADEFRQKIKEYINTTIKASLDDQDRETMHEVKKTKDSVLYLRPVDPTEEDYKEKAKAAEKRLVSSVQVHHAVKTHVCI